MNKIISISLVLLSVGTFSATFAQTNQSADIPAVKAQDTKGTPDGRADQMLKQMTTEEKISLVGGTGFTTHTIARLGIPEFSMTDGPQGVRGGAQSAPACAFPCGAALAATWDVDLAMAYGKAMGLEGRARGTHFQLGPGLNICRVPVNGRNFEYFGEDPVLASLMALNWVKGCTAEGVVPTIKHFAANNQEWNRNSADSQVDERTMNEIYLPAFKLAAQEGGNVAVMCSYNRLNGSYASNNDWLLNQMLKRNWGFQGLVMSDWGASHQTSDLAKGLDLEMPNSANFSKTKVEAALADGTVKMSDLDNAAHRILRTAFAEGWLDAGWQQKNSALPMDSADSAKAALDIALSSIVLLKNDRDTLPLNRAKVKTLFVVGPNATAPDGQAPANVGGGGSGAVPLLPSRFAEADYLKGIIKAAGDKVKVIYAPMPGDNDPNVFDVFANARTADGQPGLTLNVEVTGQGDPVQISVSVQTNINVTWQSGQLPFGVPTNRDATFTWSGLLAPPQDGDWELRVAGSPTITVDGKALTDLNGAVIHLQKSKPSSITIRAQAQANPPARGRGGRGGGGGRGGRGGGGGNQIRVALTLPAIPDLADAKTADAAIVCVGLNRNVESEGRDRPFDLPGLQQYLISAVSAANPHTVVINNIGAGVGMAAWADKTASILQAWYLGQEGGLAVGQVLFGDFNPCGRLCSTFDRTFEDNPAFAYYPGTFPQGAAYPVEPYTEGIFYGYRGYDKAGKAPLYPFGYGLSYTTFELSGLKVTKAGQNVTATLSVKNSGRRDGAEVVQIYVGESGAVVPRPLRELKGFSKVTLKAGETKKVEISLPASAFAYWSPDKKDWTTDSGKSFTIEAGLSERDLKLKGTITLP